MLLPLLLNLSAAATLTQGWDLSFADDFVSRRQFLTADQQSFVLPPQPERTSTLAVAVHPDAVYRPSLGAQQQLAVSEVSPKPERTSVLAAEWHPDRVDRPSLHTSNHLAISEVEPQPEDKVEGDWRPLFPERALRTWLPTAGHPFLALAPRPERTSTLWSVAYPDRVDRPSLHASAQLGATENPPAPERTSTLAVEIHPDAVFRPFLHAASQLAATELSPQPERTSALAWTWFPDRTDRASLHASAQPYAPDFAPQPEDRADLDWSPVYPDRALRIWISAANQLPLAFAPKPERTSSLASVGYPDSVTRPSLHASAQVAVSEVEPAPEERVELDWSPGYPDRATRALEGAWAQPFFATSAQPERTLALASTSHPDRINGAFFGAGLQLAAGAFYPAPILNTIQLGWSATYPDRVSVVRPVFDAAQQLGATELSPFPIATAALVFGKDPVYPETVRRAWLPTAGHQASAFAPAPERTAPLASETHPDRIDRPQLLAAEQLAITGISPSPIAGAAPTFWSPLFPDSALRAVLPSAAHPTFAFAPQPERKSPIACEVHPDRVDRPVFLVALQLAATELSPRPEERVDLDWDPQYPDRATRAWLSAAAHPAFVTSAKPEDVVELDWSPAYPDRSTRAWLPTSAQPFVGAFAPAPERTRPIASTSFPDAVARPSLHASSQLASTELSPKPERTSPLAIEWHSADRVDRPFLLPSEQLAATELSPRPERNAPLFPEWHPDSVYRPTFRAVDQLAVTEIHPNPFFSIFQVGWGATFPDEVLRPFFAAASQDAWTFGEQPDVAGPFPPLTVKQIGGQLFITQAGTTGWTLSQIGGRWTIIQNQ